MNQVLEFFQKLFETADWPPRWHCGKWSEFHGWLYIISDLLIWSAYFAIPLTILKYISKRVQAKFVRAYFLFAAFILACGATHLLDALAFWFPAYRLNALVRFITGVVSWVTVFYLIRILPDANKLRSHDELEREIAERQKVEEELKMANYQLNTAQELAKIGHWQWDVQQNSLSWSDELYKIYQADKGEQLSFEVFINRVHPEDREMVKDTVQHAMETQEDFSFKHRIALPGGEEKILQSQGEVIANDEGVIIKMIGTGQDITEYALAQQQLMDRTHELEVSNSELQKFAYIASHDLQEPLRKIKTFASLLDRELQGEMPENAKMYMSKIQQSTERMQRLINDILQFSSLNTTKDLFVKTDLNEVISNVLSDIEVQIESSGATISVSNMPTIEVIPSQVSQLFQNIISNAIKFRKENEALKVTISGRIFKGEDLLNDAVFDEKHISTFYSNLNWRRELFAYIVVSDNGVGFDEAYAEKIFEIFQRLQTGKNYEGTGIGLAISKKIVDNHKGVIVAKGANNEGATFYMLLPVSQKPFASVQVKSSSVE